MNKRFSSLLPLVGAIKEVVGASEHGYRNYAKIFVPVVAASALMIGSTEVWADDTLWTSVNTTGIGVVTATTPTPASGQILTCSNSTLGSSSCAATYTNSSTTSGVQVSLTASPSGSYMFTGWSGTAAGCTGSVSIITVTTTPNSTANCTATFAPKPVATLTVQVTGTTSTGTGIVTGSANPAALTGNISTCPTTCVATYDNTVDVSVSLTATPSNGSTFTGWTGSTGCAGTTSPLTFTIPKATTSSSVSCTATFGPPAVIAPVQRVHIFDTTTNATVFKGSSNQISPPLSGTGIPCVNFGIVTSGTEQTKLFTVGSTVPTSGTPDQVTSIQFSPDPDSTFKFDAATSKNLDKLFGLTTTAPGNTGSFAAVFKPPTGSVTTATSYNRQLQVFTTDPVAKPIAIPISAYVVPNTLPSLQLLDESSVVVGSVTPIDFGTTTVGSPRVRTFTVQNNGFGDMTFAPTAAQFTGTGFTANPYGKTALKAPTPTASSVGCSTTLGNFDSTTFTVTLDASAVGDFTGTVSVAGTATSGGSPITFKFPVKGTVVPPPPTQPEIDVYDGTKSLIHNTDVVDFGTTPVGTSVIRTLTVKNPSTATLTVYDFSANLPAGFSLVNPSYSSNVAPGASVDLGIKLDATAAGTYSGQLRIPSNDADNGDGVENPFTIPLKGTVSSGATSINKLTVTVTGAGTVASDSGGINCGTGGSVCDAGYAPGAAVKLTATAETGSTFAGWSGDCTGTTASATVTLSAAKNCTATFSGTGGSGTGGAIALEITPPTNGNVTSDIPATGKINCGTKGTICKVDTYSATDNVNLSATPETGFVFSGWGGNCSGTVNPLSVAMDVAKKCSATFTAEGSTGTGNVVLAILKPTGGTVTTDIPATGGINCGVSGSACTVATYKTTDVVQLTATPSANGQFDAWGGDCSGNTNPLPLAMSTAKVCSASFTALAPTTSKIEVLEGAAPVADGSTTPIKFADTPVGTAVKKDFTIKNTGTADLTLSAPTLPAGFSIVGTFPTTVAVGSTGNFTIQLDAKSAGTFTGEFSFTNNDATQNPFNFALTGTVTALDTTVTCFESQNGIVINSVCTTAAALTPGNSLAVGTPDVTIKGGISKNNGPYLQEDTVVLADNINTAGVIKVAATDIGKKADIIVAGIHNSPEAYPDLGFAWYMLDGCSTCVAPWPYDKRAAIPVLSALKPLLSVSSLPAYLPVELYAGPHFVLPGFLDIFFGYRIAEGADKGKIIFNADAIKVTIKP